MIGIWLTDSDYPAIRNVGFLWMIACCGAIFGFIHGYFYK